MCYMMSPQGFLNDSAGHWVPHLMFYIPLTDPKSWGSGFAGFPGYVKSAVSGRPGTNNRAYGSGAHLVGWNTRSQVAMNLAGEVARLLPHPRHWLVLAQLAGVQAKDCRDWYWNRASSAPSWLSNTGRAGRYL